VILVGVADFLWACSFILSLPSFSDIVLQPKSAPRSRRRSKGVPLGVPTKHDPVVCGRKNARNMEKVTSEFVIGSIQIVHLLLPLFLPFLLTILPPPPPLSPSSPFSSSCLPLSSFFSSSQFPPDFLCGDIGGTSQDFRLPNSVYNTLREHSYKEDKQVSCP